MHYLNAFDTPSVICLSCGFPGCRGVEKIKAQLLNSWKGETGWKCQRYLQDILLHPGYTARRSVSFPKGTGYVRSWGQILAWHV